MDSITNFISEYGEQIKDIISKYINLLLSFLKEVADIEFDTALFTDAE